MNWTPIGISGNYFNGIFDGCGHEVSGLNVSGGGYKGLFAYNSGTIRNLRVDGAVSALSYVGGIVGRNFGTIENCISNVNVTIDGSNGGGIAGENQGTISGCTSSGDVVSSNGVIGGIVGTNSQGTIIDCINGGTVSTSNSSGTIGGIAGDNAQGTISGCTNNGTVSGGTPAGGIAGINSGSIRILIYAEVINCTNSGAVSGSRYVGGIIGEVGELSTVKGCVNSGSVDAIGNVSNSSHVTIENCLSASEAAVINGDEEALAQALEDNGFETLEGTYARGDEISLNAAGTISSGITLTYTLTTESANDSFRCV